MSTFSLYNNTIHTPTVNGSKSRDHELTREKIVLQNANALIHLNEICSRVDEHVSEFLIHLRAGSKQFPVSVE